MILILMLTTPVSAATMTYQIQRGDTLWRIAQEHGMSLLRLLDLNKGITPDNLIVGQKILVETTGERYHTVRQTDTLHAIGKMYGVPVDVLMEVNGFTTHTNLYVGQKVLIPGQEKERTETYRVRSGDTYWSIAQEYGTTVEVLQRLNKGIPADMLQVGSLIKLPTKKEQIHTVRSGETLYQIAREYNTTIEDLMDWNDITRPNIIEIGQKLVIRS
jgi:LysM repeat protein